MSASMRYEHLLCTSVLPLPLHELDVAVGMIAAIRGRIVAADWMIAAGCQDIFKAAEIQYVELVGYYLGR